MKISTNGWRRRCGAHLSFTAVTTCLCMLKLNAAETDHQAIRAPQHSNNQVTLESLASRGSGWASAAILGTALAVSLSTLNKRRRSEQKHVDQIRQRIAADLHDDIGSNLGSLSLIARSARKDLIRLEGPKEIAHDLSEMESIARECSLAMRDIVWMWERSNDSVGDLIERMRQTANRLLREMRFNLECQSCETNAHLSIEAKRHLFLFFKEALHNIMKHSRANQVTVRVWDENDQLAIEIVDNGSGLPGTNIGRTPAIRKLQDRAQTLHGLLRIASNRDQGTRIQLFVKHSHLITQPAI
jgi:signal transduction histidine kinase